MPTDRSTEDAIVHENVDYVLGMYDLYPNDKDISDMLLLKGIEPRLVQVILGKIKIPAYEKRIRQAKRMIIIGSIILVIFFVIPFSLLYIFGIDISGNNSLMNGTRTGEGMLRTAFHQYIKIYIVVVAIGVVNVLTGVFNLVKYKKLLAEGMK